MDLSSANLKKDISSLKLAFHNLHNPGFRITQVGCSLLQTFRFRKQQTIKARVRKKWDVCTQAREKMLYLDKEILLTIMLL